MRLSWCRIDGRPLPLWERSDRIEDVIRVRGCLHGQDLFVLRLPIEPLIRRGLSSAPPSPTRGEGSLSASPINKVSALAAPIPSHEALRGPVRASGFEQP